MGGYKIAMSSTGAACIFLLLALASAINICPGEGPRYGDYKCNHDSTHRVCARLKNASGDKLQWGSGDFCICMWATARLISQVGCANVHLDCSATDVSYVMGKYSDGGVDLKPAKDCLASKCPHLMRDQTNVEV